MHYKLLFFIIACCFSTEAPAQTSTNIWHGWGNQSGSEWSMELDMNTEKPSVRYPSIPCSGTWEQFAEKDFFETIHEGRSRCMDGFVELCPLDSGKLIFRFRDPSDSHLIAQAILVPGRYNQKNDDMLKALTKKSLDESWQCLKPIS